jgi:predicted nucleotidyltransferase
MVTFQADHFCFGHSKDFLALLQERIRAHCGRMLACEITSEVGEVVAALRADLGENLYSCCLYGSAVRGNIVRGVSDINLLIVLNTSDSVAHDCIASVMGSNARIDPFILGRKGLERSVHAFAAKFASIKRNYRVLHGADPLAAIDIEPKLERFLCEQAIRNLRLRSVYAYVTRSRHKTYGSFLSRSVTPLFLRLSEIIRLSGSEVSQDFVERIRIFESKFAIDASVLHELLAFKRKPRVLSEAEIMDWHARLIPILDAAIGWIESHWQTSPFTE